MELLHMLRLEAGRRESWMANKQQMTSPGCLDTALRPRLALLMSAVFVGVRVYGSEVGKLCIHVTTAVWRGSVAKSQFLWWTVERALTAFLNPDY
jgi:hypothetical protein